MAVCAKVWRPPSPLGDVHAVGGQRESAMVGSCSAYAARAGCSAQACPGAATCVTLTTGGAAGRAWFVGPHGLLKKPMAA